MYPDFFCALSMVREWEWYWGGIAAQFVGFCCHTDTRALAVYSVFKMKLGRKLPCPVSVNSSLQLLLLHTGLPSGLSNCQKTSQLLTWMNAL